jgi:UDP-glucose 4-epimerase
MKPDLLITGANGFIGKALCKEAINRTYSVSTLTRKGFKLEGQKQNLVLDDYTDSSIIQTAFNGVDVVIHLAARVHVMNETDSDALGAYRAINVRNTVALAQAAVAAGVKRFVYLSSVKVNGEETSEGNSFSADGLPNPQDPYGISKLEAENALLALSQKTGMEVVIIRPPLVYGPGVVANFAAMMKAVARGMPLPLGAIRNRRSMVFIGNLIDLILLCTTHSAASGQVFLVSDDHDISLPELLKNLALALKVPVRLISISVSWIWLIATLFGRRNMAQRLCSSLQLDISKTKERLSWEPPYSLEQGLAKTAQWFMHTSE